MNQAAINQYYIHEYRERIKDNFECIYQCVFTYFLTMQA